ncbi:unnamed protein product [Rhizophagus irregularis]|nr:unnamed protein product [Rhizophagus irregularis]CAB5367267.1 unnamed protein product [Rhizophagus irregularis]
MGGVSQRHCLQILEAEYNIEPLCRFIKKTLLKSLKDNSVKHSNEEALKQAFIDTLILILHANIEPEFQVYSWSLDFFGGKVIYLVKTSASKMIAIESRWRMLYWMELKVVGRKQLMFHDHC